MSLTAACSDLLDSNAADVVVQLEAKDEAAVARVRQDVLASASTWGGVRVGEQTGEVGASSLEFTLPGESLDIALGALDGVADAQVTSTEIDVDAEQIERTTTTTAADSREAADGDAGRVRLRVEVTGESPTGLEGVVRALMAVFSVIGLISTVRWLRSLPGRHSRRSGRDDGDPPRRNIDRVDLRRDPPTQETPRIPPGW